MQTSPPTSQCSKRFPVLFLLVAAIAATAFAQDPPYRVKPIESVDKTRLLPPADGNPRNSEGDFIQLKDGRLMFVYTHFTGGGSDNAAAHLAARFSRDRGKTWTNDDIVVVEREGEFNVMSVSLLRLTSGEIALFYLRKNSHTDCRPVMRVSRDEGASWSKPAVCIDDVGYYVLNNDRAVQLNSGRLLLPVSRHNTPEQNKFDGRGVISCFLSDDNGKSWRQSETKQQGDAVTLQEPGVVALKDGRLMMFCRTPHGSQYVSYSKDDGVTWSPFKPSNIVSPLSPATIERIPKTGDLLLVWNNHDGVDAKYRGKRTPLNVAISRDEGTSWEHVKTLEDDPNGWYCYTAIAFVGDHVLLGHCAGDRRTGGLNTTQITRFSLDWLYDKDDPKKADGVGRLYPPEQRNTGRSLYVKVAPVPNIREFRIYVAADPAGRAAKVMTTIGSAEDGIDDVRGLQPNIPMYIWATCIDADGKESRPSPVRTY